VTRQITGKTIATLWSWDYLHSNGLCGKMLVVAGVR
jgi:hypothetical protein